MFLGMCENFSDGANLQMDRGGVSASDPLTPDILKIEKDPEIEIECPREPSMKQEVDLDIKTGPQLLMKENLESVVKSEYPRESEYEETEAQIAISKVFTMRVSSLLTSSTSSDNPLDKKNPIKKRSTKDNLRMHTMHTNINKGVKLFTCKVCNYRTWKKTNMKAHKSTHIGRELLFARDGQGSQTSNTSKKYIMTACPRKGTFKCDLCDYRSSKTSSMKEHMRTHTKINGKGRRKIGWSKGSKDHRSDQPAEPAHDQTDCFIEPPHDEKGHSIERAQDKMDHLETLLMMRKSQELRDSLEAESSNVASVDVGLQWGEGFKCDVCDYESSQQSALKLHKTTHSKRKSLAHGRPDSQAIRSSVVEKRFKTNKAGKQFMCKECSYQTIYKGNLVTHERIHTGEKPFKCDECDYQSAQQSPLKVHIRSHTGEKPYICDICDYRSNYRAQVVLHKKREHTKKNSKGWRKIKCSKELKDVCSDQPIEQAHDMMNRSNEPAHDKMDHHFQPGHGEIAQPTEQAHDEMDHHIQPGHHEITQPAEQVHDEMEGSIEKNHDEKALSIETAHDKMDDLGTLLMRRQGHELMKSLSSNATSEEFGRHRGTGFKCDVCDYQSTQQSALKLHKTIHIKRKSFARGCPDSQPIRSSAVEKHIKTSTGGKQLMCEDCGYWTRYKTNLITHKRTHTGERPFKCDVCDYRSAQQSALKTHMKTHTGERPFKCDVCDYRSAQRSALKTHMKTHTGEKPYICDVCNYRSDISSTLQVHMRTHAEINGKGPRKKRHSKGSKVPYLDQPIEPSQDTMDRSIVPAHGKMDLDEISQATKPAHDARDHSIEPAHGRMDHHLETPLLIGRQDQELIDSFEAGSSIAASVDIDLQ